MLTGVNLWHGPEVADPVAQRSLLRGWDVVRPMETQRTNITNGRQRRFKTLDDLPQVWQKWQYTAGPWDDFDGVPLAVLLKIINQAGARPWMCAPHSFDDEALGAFAEYVIANSWRRPILEFSNELWNGRFFQRDDCGGWPAVLDVQARKTAVLHEAANGQADVVLSGQAANVWIAEQLVGRTTAFDAIGIAPYFFPGRVSVALENARRHVALGRRIGRPVWGYEVGHHDMTGDAVENAESPQRLAEIRAYLQGLKEAGVGLVCWYNLASQHKHAYAWGLYRIETGGAAVETAALSIVRGGV